MLKASPDDVLARLHRTSMQDEKDPPGAPSREPVKEPPGRPGRNSDKPAPIDDPRPPKPKRQ